MKSLAILTLASISFAGEIPNKPLHGELAGKAFVPNNVFFELDGNREWYLHADLDDGAVTVKIPIEFAPAKGECIEQPPTRADGAVSDMRSGTNVYSAGVEYTLRFDEVSADRAKGGIYAKFSPVKLAGKELGEHGSLVGRFDAAIKHPEDFGVERKCSKSELAKPKAPAAGTIGKTKLSPKTWQLVELPDNGLRAHHWRLRADQLGIDLDGTPAVGCTTRTITGRRMEAFVGLDPLTYVVAFDSITTDKATGWVTFAWEDSGSTITGRFEATIVHDKAPPDVPHLCK